VEDNRLKFFNTAGPVVAEDHYCVPVSQRVRLDEIQTLIDQKKYFVLHAPRQSGKTTALLEIMRQLNGSGRFKCLYVNVEPAQAARESVDDAMDAIVDLLVESEKNYLPDDAILARIVAESAPQGKLSALSRILGAWARASTLPTVLLIDEIDSLVGDTLVSVLRQLRGGYASRPKSFPQSVVLCGVRDIRDYRIHASHEKDVITGGSCFNINAESLVVGNFSKSEVEALYGQHTADTGQAFTPDAIALAFDFTQGQPWLVNALAYEACFKSPEGKNRQYPITPELIRDAKEALIRRRVTHLDQLADKLKEPRVRRIIAPMLEGIQPATLQDDDIQYVTDLGLITSDRHGIRIANPIYQEVVPRQLTAINQTLLKSEVDDLWYINADGSIAIEKLLTDFQRFFRENSESWIQRFDYQEAGPQLLLQAYLQRVINGGGRIEREYGLGRMRTDLLLVWPYKIGGEKREQRVVFELNIQHQGREKTLGKGYEQISAYLDPVGEHHGHLLVFDRDPKVPWDDKVYRNDVTHNSHAVTIWGM
jgi:hypothetical protein